MTSTVFVLMGVSGCGKSSVAAYLADKYQANFVEGDDLHSTQAKSKMSGGEGLTDEDRLPWLQRIVAKCDNNLLNAGLNQPSILFLTCSSLKQRYRNELRKLSGEVHFIYIAICEQTSFKRVSARTTHFLSPDIVASQFEALQEPNGLEQLWVKLDGHKEFESVCKQASHYVEAILKGQLP